MVCLLLDPFLPAAESGRRKSSGLRYSGNQCVPGSLYLCDPFRFSGRVRRGLCDPGDNQPVPSHRYRGAGFYRHSGSYFWKVHSSGGNESLPFVWTMQRFKGNGRFWKHDFSKPHFYDSVCCHHDHSGSLRRPRQSSRSKRKALCKIKVTFASRIGLVCRNQAVCQTDVV